MTLISATSALEILKIEFLKEDYRIFMRIIQGN